MESFVKNSVTAADFFPLTFSVNQTTNFGETSRPSFSVGRVNVKGINTIHISCSGTWVSGGLYGVDGSGNQTLIQGGGETSNGSYNWDKDYNVAAYEYIKGNGIVAGSITLTFSNPQ